MTTDWTAEKYDAETQAERDGKKALRAKHESLARIATPQIDQASIKGVNVEPLAPGQLSQSTRRFLVGGLPVRCPHCQAEGFSEGSGLLGEVGISFAHHNWATQKKVTNLMCDRCGLLQWFGTTPQKR